MTSIFDGISSIITSVLGDTVTIYPGGGAGVEIQALFREDQIPMVDENGIVVNSVSPILKAHRSDMANMYSGDLVELNTGKKYQYLSQSETGNPSWDGLVVVQLELI